MDVTQFPRSRWMLKADQNNPQSPRADPFIQTNFGDSPDISQQSVVTDIPNSDYVRCYRSPDRFELCEKFYGCCTTGCCPKDEWWMAGVYVLIAFVILVAIVAVVVGVVCYQRSSKRKKKDELYYSTGESMLGSQPYSSEIGSHHQRHMGAPY